MTFFVPVTFLLLNYLLSCFAAHTSTLNATGITNMKILLREYTDALLEVKAKQLDVYVMRARKTASNVIKQLKSESYRLDRLYGLKWINELIASRVFQANEVIDKDTRKRYADQYEVEKRLNKSAPLHAGSKILLNIIENKWKVRAGLYATEDAYLPRSSTKCLKKEDNTSEKMNLVAGAKRIRDLEEFVFVKLYETGEAYINEGKSNIKYELNEAILKFYMNELVNKIEEVERERLNYLQMLCPGERAKVLIDTVNAEFHTPAK
ncbi:unnamed protein product [Trichobilharzia szidati]|nr:unnamed protein product [Trichobilharzia szidati]